MKRIKKMKKIVAFVLALAIVVSLVDTRITKADNNGMVNSLKTVIEDANGNKYDLECFRSKNGKDYKVVIISKGNKGKLVFDYKNQHLYYSKYDNTLDLFGKKVYKKTENVEYDFSGVKDKEVEAQGYASCVSCKLPTLKGNHVRYWNGNSGKDVGYCKIACVAKYRVKNDKPYVQDMKDNVKSSNRALVESGVSTVVVVGLIAIFAAFPWGAAAAIALISSTTGCGVFAASKVWKSICDATDAHEYFDQAKAYGNKI